MGPDSLDWRPGFNSAAALFKTSVPWLSLWKSEIMVHHTIHRVTMSSGINEIYRETIAISLKAKQLTVSVLDSRVSPLLPSWERDGNWSGTQSNLQVSTASDPDAE